MNSKEIGLNFFKEKCKERNLKITPQRIAIYEQLMGDSSHPTADAVYQKIHKKFPHISFDTVNRTLLLFAETGIIKQTEHFGKHKRFDPDIDNHHHLFCVKCNRIIDFYSKEYDDIKIPEIIIEKYTVLGKKVVLEGICDKCRDN